MALTKVSTPAIKDEAITLAKLLHGDANSDGKFLRANNGADPSFETVSIPAGTTINNNADDRLITGSGTANTLNGESALTFSGTLLKLQVDSGEFRIESANGVDQLSVDSDNGNTFINGTVGIGEVSPARKLSVSGGTFPALRLKNTSTSIANGTNICGIEFEHADSSAPGVCAGIHAQMADTSTGGLHMRFLTGTNVNLYAEKMRLTSAGNLGIGLTNPEAYDSYANQLVVYGAGHAGITIRGNYANTGNIYFADGTSGGEKYDGFVSYSYPTARLAFGTNGTTRVRITNDGICFHGDTATANALYDYEEGSWSPSLSSGTAVWYNQQWYTKIGRMVTCYVYMYAFSDTSSGTHVKIGGLPFARNSARESSFTFTVQGNPSLGSGCSGVTGRIGVTGNSTQISLYRDFPTSGGGSLNHQHLGNGHFYVTFTYPTDS